MIEYLKQLKLIFFNYNQNYKFYMYLPINNDQSDFSIQFLVSAPATSHRVQQKRVVAGALE